jgi:integrase
MTNSKLLRPARNVRSDWRKSMGLHPDYPLFPHQNGRWAKKVRGKQHYFGKISDDPKGEAALLKWLDEKDDLLAGRMPRTKGAGLTVGELCDRFLQAKDKRLETGEITYQTRLHYGKTSNRIVAQFGKNRLVSDLASDDFESLRASIATTRGPVALGNEIQRVRIVFKYGYDEGLIVQPMRYGASFKRPSNKVLRLERARKGPKLFEAAGLLKLITAADVHLRAMIHLAINCGFGNSDCGMLPLAALDLDGGWVNYHRPKTGIDRRCPLWPETVIALRESLAKRPPVKSADAEPLVFVTKYGASWAKETADNPITKAFRKLLDAQGLHRKGIGFYTLRHTFRTIADGCRDQPAVDAIMGHADASMAARYRERIDDSRFLAATNHVRAWLWPKASSAAKPAAKGKGSDTTNEKSAPLRVVG